MLKQYPRNQFAPLTEEYLELVFIWRNTPRIRTHMHNDREIIWKEHMAWFNALKQDDSREFWLLNQNDRPIGILNFSGIGSQRVEWGCYLGETDIWPGSGILFEVAALDRAVSFNLARILAAEVLSFNKSAIGLHKLFQYPLIQKVSGGERNGQSFDTLCYEYPLVHWQQNRADVLSKLPKPLRAVAEELEFREIV